MNLTTLIPDALEIAVSFEPIVGDGSSGLTGVADRLQSQDFGGAAGALGSLLLERVDAALPAEGGLPFQGAIGTLSSLANVSGAPPADLTSALDRPLAEVDGILARLPQLVESLNEAARLIEQAQGGDVGPLVQTAAGALLDVAGSVAGPDLAGLDGWRAYLVELAEEIRALIELGGSQDEIRDRLLAAALARIREAIVGLAPEVTSLLEGAEEFLGGLLPDIPALDLPGLRDAAIARLDAVRTAAEADAPDLQALVDEYNVAARLVTDTFHNLLDDLEAALSNPLLTPGGVAGIVGGEIDRVRATKVDDFSDVEARVEAFFTRIEESVDAVDLSAIGEGIDGFFGTVQGAIETVNPASIEEQIDAVTAQVDGTLERVGETITTLTSQVQGWLTELTDGVRGGLAELGEVGPDGRFHFAFESEIDGLYARVDALIQGDPANPGAFSIRGTLEEFRSSITALIGELETLLTGLVDQLIAARDQAASALDGVRAEIEAVDPQAVMDQANAALEGAFEQIGTLDFGVVVDPVIEELEKARDELAAIDVSQLDDFLREALATALEAVLSLDFEVEITGAVMVEFDELLDIPRNLLRQVGEKVNELIARITDISPEALFEPLQAQIDRMTSVLDVEIAPALAPLTDAFEELVERVRGLDPTQFLTPLVEGFEQLTGTLDGLEPEALLQPVQAQIDDLADRVRSIDLDAPLASVNAVFGDIDRFLDGIDPRTLLAPLREPFGLVNRTLEPLRPSVLLAPVADVLDQVGDLVDAIPDSIGDTLATLFDEAMSRADSLDPTALFAQIRVPIEALRARLDLIRPGALLHALQQAYTPVRAAVSASDGRTGASVTVRLEIGTPTLSFGAVIGRYERLVARLDEVLAGLDPAPLAAAYGEARGRIEELLPRAIRDDMTASRLRTLIGLADPSQFMERLDAIYQRVLDKLNLLDPAQIIEPLGEVYDAVRAAVAAVDIGQLTARIETLLGRVAELIESISLEDVLQPVLALVDELKGIVGAIDPAPLIEGLSDRFDALIDLFEQFGPQAIIDELQEAWEALAGRIRELFDLEVIAEPLLGVFEAVQTLLGGLDAGVLVATIDARLQLLRDDLEEALERTAAAFRAMISAVPLRGAGAGASASVSL
ncbi:MAG TPA: hypothetical protein VFZ18_15375 [Longimicrobiaceae bacterium]